MSAPLLIHIGFQRTLTTWLQSKFFSDPNNDFHVIGLRSENDHKSRILNLVKGRHPLTVSAQDLRDFYQEYTNGFDLNGKVPVISNERLCGNNFAGAYDCAFIADKLHEAFPRAKILIGFREQSDMILSHWTRYIATGGFLDVDQYLTQKDNMNARYPIFDKDSFSYEKLVGYYMKLFGQENVLALPLELFRENPQNYVDSIYKHCGLQTSPVTEANTIMNRNHNMYQTEYMRGINAALGYPLFGEGRVKAKLRKLSKSAVTKIANLKSEEDEKKLKQIKKQKISKILGSYYAEGNQELSKLTGHDLSHYGYNI